MPISAADFQADPSQRPAQLSARFDPARPFLFDGLAPRFATRLVRSCFFPMRDGTRLSMDFHIPLGATLPLPVILVRTPYGKRSNPNALTALLPEQGFVYAVQDVRGRNESEGVFEACTGQDREDGEDTVAWLSTQPWCNGAIGTIGASYTGETSAKTAAMRHPAHRCAVIMFDGSYAGGASQNGAFLQGGISLMRMLFQWFREYVPTVSYGPPAHVDRERWFGATHADAYAMQPVALPPVDLAEHLRTLPVVDLVDRSGAPPSAFAEMMRRAADPTDAYWSRQGFLTDNDSFDLPALYVTGHLERGGSSFDNFRLMRKNASPHARAHQHLLVTPAPHSAYHLCEAAARNGVRSLGDTRLPYYRMLVDWFGQWLRNETAQVETWPPVRYFVVNGQGWRDASDWPPADATPWRLFLRSDGRANSAVGDGTLSDLPPSAAEPADAFVYDPGDPVPSEPPAAELDILGGGYADRAAIECRADVLVYTTAPLQDPLEIVGPVTATLHVSSDALDTDFSAVLSELDASGRSINVTHGMARMRYRNGRHRAPPLEAGQVHAVTIDLWHAAILIPAGHCIRLSIASSHFPFYERNLNTGGDNFTDTHWLVARNRVLHNAWHQSALDLFVRQPRPA